MNLASRLIATVLTVTFAGTAGLMAERQPNSYSARIVDFEQPRGSDPSLLQVRVTRWATDAERDQLTDALLQRGQHGLLAELSKLEPAGVIRTPGSAGYTFRYARRVPLASGAETVLVVIDRPIGFAEFRQGGQTRDYPFTIVAMEFAADGTGSGRVLAATRLHASDATKDLAFEQYHASALVLQGLRRE